jgi:hypothetical protein
MSREQWDKIVVTGTTASVGEYLTTLPDQKAGGMYAFRNTFVIRSFGQRIPCGTLKSVTDTRQFLLRGPATTSVDSRTESE